MFIHGGSCYFIDVNGTVLKIKGCSDIAAVLGDSVFLKLECVIVGKKKLKCSVTPAKLQA